MEPGTLISIMLALVVYLTDGTPLPNSFILPADHACTPAVAVEYANRFVRPILPVGTSMKDPSGPQGILFLCLPVEQGSPGPAHIPQENEA